MKIFIWDRIDVCSKGDFHSEGGVVVVAENEERAREIANANGECEIRPDEKVNKEYLLDERNWDSTPEEMIFFFPDAGCC